MRVFRDRREGGRLLATELLAYADRPDVIVLGLPRGGVPVAFEVAQALHAPLDIYMVRKLGLPGYEEFAMGAVGPGGIVIVNPDVFDALGVPGALIETAARRESAEIARRERIYRDGHPAPELTGRTVLLVDDGIATGSTMMAAIAALRRQHPSRVIVATPVVAAATVPTLARIADELVCIEAPEDFVAVGQFYFDFTPTTDDEVRELLLGRGEHGKPRGEPTKQIIAFRADGAILSGDLTMPSDAQGIVLFAHGTGSSRHSPRNQFVAKVLQDARMATLLVDLLTEPEEASERFTAHLRFDIDLLARRLIAATNWILAEASTRHLAIGYFGASTGAGAALVAAAERPGPIAAVVSRGGRPDLAGPALSLVRAPTLLIVGGRDLQVLDLNHQALGQLQTEKRLEIVPGASHLFEEPGSLERVAELASEWFEDHLTTASIGETSRPRSPTSDWKDSKGFDR